MTKRILRSQLVSAGASRSPLRRARSVWRWGALAIVGIAAVAVGATFKPSELFKAGAPVLGRTLISGGARPAQAAAPIYHADCSASPAPLQRTLSGIARAFDGEVGIAVTKAGCEWVTGERTNEFFPQQSVSKLWVSLTVLDAVDRGKMRLDQTISIGPTDLTLFNQPLRAAVLERGRVDQPVLSLMSQALSHSDNTANDRLLWTAGGPEQVRAMLKAKGITGIRFGPGERLLQSHISGLTWRQDFSLGRNFEQARALLPAGLRQNLLDNYIANPMDGATPAGIARTLGRLATGQLLSPDQTAVMMDILSRTHSGPRRLKGGVTPGWTIYHKTGTGQELGRLATGYNDVGILQAPDGAIYGVAVMIRRTTVPIPVRMDMMQSVSRAISQFHEASSTR
ncbi:MAG: beta-lactamase [Novosphingobium sp.]|nr:beta-lactamase [Novosphingobium sp.]